MATAQAEKAKQAMAPRESGAPATARDRKHERALSVFKQEPIWGMPPSPQARKALAAITAHYGLDPLMGDILVLGNALYITAEAYLKRIQVHPRFAKWTKRVATAEEKEALGYDKSDAVFYTELHLWMPDGKGGDKGESYPATGAFGQANVANCQLENVSKQKGDARILNRMAIKRAQHECTRDIVSFNLFEVPDMPDRDELISAGVRVITEDGVQELPQPQEPAAHEGNLADKVPEAKSPGLDVDELMGDGGDGPQAAAPAEPEPAKSDEGDKPAASAGRMF